MTFDQLYYFCEVYRQKSLSDAARNLRISRQSLSFSIKRLEEELDTVLFFRNCRGINATHSGDIFYQYAQRTLLENWKIRQYVSQKSCCGSPSIHKIAVCDYIMGTIGKELYNLLSSNFPGEYFSFSVLDANIPLEQQTNYDLILTIINQKSFVSHDLELLFSEEWSIKYLQQYIIHVWISSTSRYAEKKTIKFTELQSVDFCTLRNYINDTKTKLDLFLGYYKMSSLPVSFQLEENLADYIERLGYATIDIKLKNNDFGFAKIFENKNVVVKPTDALVTFLAIFKKGKNEYFYQYIFDSIFKICGIN